MISKLSTAEEQFLGLLRYGVCGGVMPKENLYWDEIIKLAKQHRVGAILCDALRDEDSVPGEIRESLQNVWRQEVVRDTRQQYSLEQICKVLEDEKIPFAPMKGLVLKHDYPNPYMRYMSDLDFYIQPTDRDRIHACMERLSARVSNVDGGDINYEMPGRVQVEFHGRLLYRMDSTGVNSYSDWSCVSGEENCLTEEGYALNLIGHIAYNIANAGCGVRFILDLWVYRHKHAQQPQWNVVMQRLREDGLEKIAVNLLDLSEYWFGDRQGTPLLEELGKYILEGGLYGLAKRETLSNAGLSGSKLKAVKAQIFRSEDEFYNRYPWLKKYPYLLPVAWGMRGIHSMKIHRGEIGNWMKQMGRSSQKEINEQRERLSRFGISAKK